MTIDEKLRDASNSVREAGRHARFSVETPTRYSTRSRVTVFVAAAALVLLVVGLPLLALRGFGQRGTVGGTSDTTAATSTPDAAAVPPTEETSADAIPPSSEVSDITDLVVSVETSSEVPGFGAEYLIDGDLGRGWQDNSLRGVGAEIRFTFDEPVAISYLLFYPVGDEDGFTRNFKVQGYEISDSDTTLVGKLLRTMEPQRIEWGVSETDYISLRVITTFPAEPVRDLPPFDELAIAEIRVFGRTIDGGPTADTTTTVTAPSLDESSARFVSPALDVSEGSLPWDAYIANAMTGNEPVELRGQLLNVNEAVMSGLGALPLQYSSGISDAGLLEGAEFLYQSRSDDGRSNILISVLWQEWDGRTEANPLRFPSDAVHEQWGGDSIFINIESDRAEFGAINVGALKTISWKLRAWVVLPSRRLRCVGSPQLSSK